MNELELRDELRGKRKEIDTFDDLIDFLRYVKENCNSGYGEAPRAIAQASLAVAWKFAGWFDITGFQASCAMWDFIQDWQYRSNKCGLKMVDYDEMLYPQYDYKFEKTIKRHTWEALQKRARELLAEDRGVDEVREHWQSIADGKVPFGYTVIDD